MEIRRRARTHNHAFKDRVLRSPEEMRRGILLTSSLMQYSSSCYWKFLFLVLQCICRPLGIHYNVCLNEFNTCCSEMEIYPHLEITAAEKLNISSSVRVMQTARCFHSVGWINGNHKQVGPMKDTDRRSLFNMSLFT